MYMHTKWFLQFRRKRCKKTCAHFLQLHSKSVSFFCLASGTSLFKHINMCKSFYGLRALWYLGLWHPMLVQIIPLYVPI